MKRILLNENIASKLKFKVFNDRNIKPIYEDLLEYERFINLIFTKIKNTTINDVYNNNTLVDGKSIEVTKDVLLDKKNKINNLIKLVRLEYYDFIDENKLESDDNIMQFINGELLDFNNRCNNIINKVDELIRLITIISEI